MLVIQTVYQLNKHGEIMHEEFEDEEKEDFLLDEISGRKKKPVMSVLNKRKLSRYEMDDLFVEE